MKCFQKSTKQTEMFQIYFTVVGEIVSCDCRWCWCIVLVYLMLLRGGSPPPTRWQTEGFPKRASNFIIGNLECFSVFGKHNNCFCDPSSFPCTTARFQKCVIMMEHAQAQARLYPDQTL